MGTNRGDRNVAGGGSRDHSIAVLNAKDNRSVVLHDPRDDSTGNAAKAVIPVPTQTALFSPFSAAGLVGTVLF